MPAGPAVLRFARGLPPSKQFGERLRLLVIQGPDQGTCYSLIGDLMFIGREGCQISLTDSNISKKHAELNWLGDQYSVRDLGSANGIVINGQRVSEGKLKAGDIFVIGLTVIEVYSAGQARRNDRPLLPEGARRAPLSLSGPAGAAEHITGIGPSPEEVKKKRETDKKRLILYAGLFFLAFMIYFSEGDKTTIKENARLPKGEEEEMKGKKKKKQTKKEIQEALASVLPDYAVDTQQRKDAEIFFRNGVRELQNKNYRRAFTAFETALTVDPSHELAKIYLKSAKKQMYDELKKTSDAAIRSKKALRYKEARMHYDNIIRYLDGETSNNEALDSITKDQIEKLLEGAKKGIEELDEIEKKIK